VKIGIIYASWFGNGKRLVEKLAEILAEKHHDVMLLSLMEESAGIVPDADLYIFSSPTRKFSLPKNVKNFVSGFVPPRNGTHYALMTTYMDPRTIGLKKMQAILDSKGMRKVADDCRIKSLGLKGPLENDYAQKLMAFAERITKP
jgi:flavorubredoxin